MNSSAELMCLYVSMLRTINLIHQQNHWVSRGSNFYGNHLLFERIYNSAVKDADTAAEKAMGIFGDKALDINIQAAIIGKTLKQFGIMQPVEGSLAIEKEFLTVSEKVYKGIKDNGDGEMTQGLDDLILGIANSREEAVYLLQQVLKNEKIATRKEILMAAKKK